MWPKIRCDGESWKFCELNKASNSHNLAAIQYKWVQRKNLLTSNTRAVRRHLRPVPFQFVSSKSWRGALLSSKERKNPGDLLMPCPPMALACVRCATRSRSHGRWRWSSPLSLCCADHVRSSRPTRRCCLCHRVPIADFLPVPSHRSGKEAAGSSFTSTLKIKIF